jgi:hypothetical protein
MPVYTEEAFVPHPILFECPLEKMLKEQFSKLIFLIELVRFSGKYKKIDTICKGIIKRILINDNDME